ncbi:ROK family transcriptional regulator [Acetobacterium sp.]|uniref:ROK family transcriptional regulator n=1 Tax=Acetobacterium sp. TaxID=1872094 RepID=UPI002F3F1CBB
MNHSNLLENLSSDEKKIISLLLKNEYMSKNDISLSTNIKLSRLNYIMEPLEKNKIIVQEKLGQSSGGRKPVLYSVNLHDFYVIGIDVSIMYTQIVFTNLKMEILYEELFTMDNSCTPEKTINKIVEAIKKAHKDLRLDRLNLIGVGVGSVGPLDVENGIIKNPTNFYAPDWLNVPIKDILEEKLGTPVIVENGANAGVVAETLFGIGKDVSNVSYFNCGVGLRTGTISSRNLIRAINDEEEGFGHMVIDIKGKKCRCGNSGCIECYSSINAIIKSFSDEIKMGRTTAINKNINAINYKDICVAAEQKDALSKEILRDAALILGAGLANYVKLLTPDLVILSGPLMIQSKLFYDSCVESTLGRLQPDKRKRVIFNRGGYYGERAMSVGAGAMLIEKYLS